MACHIPADPEPLKESQWNPYLLYAFVARTTSMDLCMLYCSCVVWVAFNVIAIGQLYCLWKLLNHLPPKVAKESNAKLVHVL